MKLVAALVLLAVVAGGAWQLRENGILLGRDSDGPLELLSSGLAAVPQRPGDLIENVDLVRTRQSAELESIRPRRISPGLELLGPVLHEDGTAPAAETVRSWPPPRTRGIAGATVSGERGVGYGLRATEPGFYYLVGMRYRYRRGVRRFEELDDTGLCVHVSSRPDFQSCPDPDRIGGFEGLAEIGGPSDYGDGEFPDDEGAVAYRMRRHGTLELVITISNLSSEAREVPRLDLGIGGDPTYKDPVDPMPSDPPAPFTIPAGGSRKVRVRARFTECDLYDQHQGTVFESIEAGDDDVELSLPVTVSGPCR